jgi:hypothetical protein
VRQTRTTYPTDPPLAGRYLLREFQGRNSAAPRICRFTIDTLGAGSDRRIEGRPAAGLPALSGSLDEGAILGGVILSLGLRIGLKDVIEAILASKQLSFGDFQTWFNTNRPALKAELDDVVEAWGL